MTNRECRSEQRSAFTRERPNEVANSPQEETGPAQHTHGSGAKLAGSRYGRSETRATTSECDNEAAVVGNGRGDKGNPDGEYAIATLSRYRFTYTRGVQLMWRIAYKHNTDPAAKTQPRQRRCDNEAAVGTSEGSSERSCRGINHGRAWAGVCFVEGNTHTEVQSTVGEPAIHLHIVIE
jgi:hypothetical protein